MKLRGLSLSREIRPSTKVRAIRSATVQARFVESEVEPRKNREETKNRTNFRVIRGAFFRDC